MSLTYDIFDIKCPVCGARCSVEQELPNDGFEVQVAAEVTMCGGEMTDTTIIDIDGNGDVTCLTCGYSGQVKDFCSEV